MRWILATVALGLLGAGAWAVGNALSSDAIGLALGVIFGVMASLPGAALVLVTRNSEERRRAYTPPPTVYQPPQPPAALLSGPVSITFEDQAGRRARVEFADPSAARRFLAEGHARQVDEGRRA